jgi:hypothetical protein
MNVLHWIQYAAPIVILLALFAWIYLLVIFIVVAPLEPNPDRRLIGKRSPADAELLRAERSFYQQKLYSIGRTDVHQILVLVMTTCVVILWLTRDPRYFDGWSRMVRSLKTPAKAGDSSVVFLFIVLMFVIPRFKKKPSDAKPLPILSWKFLEGQMFWNAFLMLGFQLVFSQSSITRGVKIKKIKANATTNTPAKRIVKLDLKNNGFRISLSRWMQSGYGKNSSSFLWILTTMVWLSSELFGGVAVSNILLYILSFEVPDPKKYPGLFVPQTNIDTSYSLPVTAMSSLCFMFPAATVTNAIVFSLAALTGCLGMLDMIVYGAALDVISWLLVVSRHVLYSHYGV